jgi:hypothetical protein
MAVYNFTNVLWAVISTFLLIAYIVVMFQIVVDLFRRPDIGGWSKAAWIIGLLFIPIIVALIYVVAHGKGMAERHHDATRRAIADTEAYVRSVAGTTPADQIARAKALFDAGTIDKDEFLRLKNRALTAPS